MQLLFPSTLSISEHRLYRITEVLKARWFSKKPNQQKAEWCLRPYLWTLDLQRDSKKSTANNSQTCTADFTVLIASYVAQTLFPNFFQQKVFHFQGTCCTCVVLPRQQHCPRQRFTEHGSLQIINALFCNYVQTKQCTQRPTKLIFLYAPQKFTNHRECFCSMLATLQKSME